MKDNKFNMYTKELEKINEKINQLPQISKISYKDFSQYQTLIRRKDFLKKQISHMLKKRTEIICDYNDKIKLWNSSNMNCRTYLKLEQKASYLRDKSLYNLGFLNQKPTLPLIQNSKNFIFLKILWPLSLKRAGFTQKSNLFWISTAKKSPICRQVSKAENYINKKLPSFLINTAISSTKECILGYRKFSNLFNNSFHKFTRNISTSKPIKVISYIANTAKQEANLQENSFKNRIKVNPITFEYCNSQPNSSLETPQPSSYIIANTSNNTSHAIISSNSGSPNYDFAL